MGFVVADTNIVSTFARIDALPLLQQLLRVDRLYITPGTYQELHRAIEAGCSFLEPVVAGIQAAGVLDLVEMTREEVLVLRELPGSLGAGEAESIAVCLHRPEAQFLTNDKRARNHCRERLIACLDLPAILRALWLRKVVGKKQVKQLIRQIETERGMVIKNK